MIGVIAERRSAKVVAEFFELFKVPWEFWKAGERYDVVLTNLETDNHERGERLTVRYGARPLALDDSKGAKFQPEMEGGRMIHLELGSLPLYGDCVSFDVGSSRSVVRLEQAEGAMFARIGYDLFAEIRWLLTEGQPAQHASFPTLELHIAQLRDLIKASGSECPELRPAPEGYRFIAALTHDVDHPSLRLHGLDHTIAGFLVRAVFGSIHRLLSGRLSFGQLLQNWAAAIRLPIVQFGWSEDFWRRFVSYTELEGNRRSTFFVIPYANRAGRMGNLSAPTSRAAAYGATDIAPELKALEAKGCEIGVHGIDSWCDEVEARKESDELERVTGWRPRGIRMHWLYFGAHSPRILDQAGLDYDSSVGYNETVGFRAGTAQVYRPLGANHLLELPLIIMDTALFYRGRLNLTPRQAWLRVEALVESAARFGGCITVNWHDRSIAPERQWGDFYRDLVRLLEARGAWVTSAAEAVDWFRKRRAELPLRAHLTRDGQVCLREQ
jgi:hypothetical protein